MKAFIIFSYAAIVLCYRPAAWAQSPSPANNASPVGQSGVALEAVPLGPMIATGGGHYQTWPLITKDGEHTLIISAKGSRVQAYVDGQPGPLVTAIPPQALNRSPAFSADGTRAGYVASLDNGKFAVVIDSTQSPVYDSVPWFSFAPVGHHFAYIATRSSGPQKPGMPMPQQMQSFVVDDGKAGLTYSQIDSNLAAFSPDGKHFAYVAVANTDPSMTPVALNGAVPQRWRVVLDGVEQKHYEKISQPIFSQDSKHLAYLAGVDGLTYTRAVIDGKEDPPQKTVDRLVISDDGSRYAYIGMKGQQGASAMSYAVVDTGKEGPPCAAVQELIVSHDGQRLAYTTLNGQGQSSVVDNGKPGLQYQTSNNLQFSPDGKTLVYTAQATQGQFLVANGQECGPLTAVHGKVAFSEDGQHWACCVGLPAGGFGVLEDGKTIPLTGVAPGELTFEKGTGRLSIKSTSSYTGAPVMIDVGAMPAAGTPMPSEVAYSPNRQHTIKLFTSNPGTSQAAQQMAIDEQAPAPGKYSMIRKPAISDDGKHVAFIGAPAAGNDKANIHAVYDGREGPGYRDVVDLALSPDGLHVAYVANEVDAHGWKWFVVIDGLPSPAFEDLLPLAPYPAQTRVRFAPDGSLQFLAYFEGQLHRCNYSASVFKSAPSLAAVEAVKPGLRELHKFEGAATAIRILLAPDETMYGISEADGKFQKGTLFSMKTDGSDFTALHDFFGGDADGEHPHSLLLAADGTLYGTLDGKVFHYEPKSQQYSLLTITTREAGPDYLAGFDADGAIVGFAGGGMPGAYRLMFSMSPDGSGYKTLDNSQFSKPLRMYQQIIAAKDGSFYAASAAGAGACLVKFKNLADAPTVLHKFVNSPTDGSYPDADLALDSKGNLYGTTRNGGMSQQGVLYRVDPHGSNYRVVYNPDKFDFTRVFAADDDGVLYGIATEGLLKLAADGSSKPVTVVAFDGSPHLLFRGQSNVFVHNGTFYGLSNKAIYKVPLAQPTAGPAAVPSVTINTIQAKPPVADAIAFGEPTGAGRTDSLGPPSQQPQTAQQSQQQQQQVQQTTQHPPAQQAPPQPPKPQQAKPPKRPNAADEAAKKAQDAANKLKGLLGQ